MDEMLDGIKAKEAKKRRSNYPEAIKLLFDLAYGDIDPMRLLHVIAEHDPGIIIKAYNAAKA